MNLLNILILLLLMTVPAWAAEVTTLEAHVRSEQVTGLTELGSVRVEGVGTVRLTARRDGNQVVVQAVRTDSTIAGKAETVVGLDETPIYVKTPNGLKELMIRWRRK